VRKDLEELMREHLKLVERLGDKIIVSVKIPKKYAYLKTIIPKVINVEFRIE